MLGTSFNERGGGKLIAALQRAVLRRARVPKTLIGLWLGHARRTVTDLYAAGLQHDDAWREEWCDRAELGFTVVGLCWAINRVAIEEQQAA